MLCGMEESERGEFVVRMDDRIGLIDGITAGDTWQPKFKIRI
jgi:hypothetical protein